MFENLTERLTGILNKLTSKGRLTEGDIDEALSLVRRSLLEADVNFRVARDFVAAVKERATGSDVLESLSPGQQVVKIVQEELTNLLSSGGDHSLTLSSQPVTIIMLVGLQGSGKTTTAAKLALHLRRESHKSLLIAADLRRPAAILQLETLGKQLDIPVYSEDPKTSTVVQVAKNGVEKARQLGVNWAIIDTGGRLQIDEELMKELGEVKKAVNPHEVLLVVDAMTGQEAVNAAEGFHAQVSLTGLIMSKMDGDARGGAALSISSVTGLPIKFIGVGEKTDALEAFHPDRLASRILGMGDIQTLAEKARQGIDEEKAREMERKFRTATFTLEDFLEQMHQLREMGPLNQILDMIPGAGLLKGKISAEDLDEDQLKKTEAMILSMTPEERQNPGMIGGSRKRRICKGSGTLPQDVNQLLNQFRQMQKLMKVMAGGKGRLPRQELTRIFR